MRYNPLKCHSGTQILKRTHHHQCITLTFAPMQSSSTGRTPDFRPLARVPGYPSPICLLTSLPSHSLPAIIWSLHNDPRAGGAVMRVQSRLQTMRLLPFVVLCWCLVPTSRADCSDSHVRSLSNHGKSVAAIARQCAMSTDDVRAALKGDDDDSDAADDDGGKPEGNGGLKRGATLSQCGCWGPVAPGAGQDNPSCASGYEHAVACPGMCSMGGSPWRRVCR